MNEENFDRLKSLISKNLGVDEDDITPNSHLQEDLNADPLSVSDLMVNVEDEFQIKIPENQTKNFIKVSDLLSYIAGETGDI